MKNQELIKLIYNIHSLEISLNSLFRAIDLIHKADLHYKVEKNFDLYLEILTDCTSRMDSIYDSSNNIYTICIDEKINSKTITHLYKEKNISKELKVYIVKVVLNIEQFYLEYKNMLTNFYNNPISDNQSVGEMSYDILDYMKNTFSISCGLFSSLGNRSPVVPNTIRNDIRLLSLFLDEFDRIYYSNLKSNECVFECPECQGRGVLVNRHSTNLVCSLCCRYVVIVQCCIHECDSVALIPKYTNKIARNFCFRHFKEFTNSNDKHLNKRDQVSSQKHIDHSNDCIEKFITTSELDLFLIKHNYSINKKTM
ncbi:hypothetical protein OAB57_02755 [Bacteriovoracaceae bacterium]|nr:hypothetical protein [Bacteriovoracaceae bacterium]